MLRQALPPIEHALCEVELRWPTIAAALDHHHIGAKDPFTSVVRQNMLSAYLYLDALLAEEVQPFSEGSIKHMLELNNRVHCGTDLALTREFSKAIDATAEKFYAQIGPISRWYWKHAARGDDDIKLAAEVYVSILG